MDEECGEPNEELAICRNFILLEDMLTAEKSAYCSGYLRLQNVLDQAASSHFPAQSTTFRIQHTGHLSLSLH